MSERTAIQWARDTAAGLLMPLGRRWAHTLGVVERTRSFADVLPAGEFDLLVAAAYLHDVGYAPELARTGFHPLDGALFVRRLGHERLAALVAYHSGARVEAEQRGLLEELTAFCEERSALAAALTCCDLTTGPDGASSCVGASRGRDCTVRRRPSRGPGDQAITQRAARACAPILGRGVEQR